MLLCFTRLSINVYVIERFYIFESFFIISSVFSFRSLKLHNFFLNLSLELLREDKKLILGIHSVKF